MIINNTREKKIRVLMLPGFLRVPWMSQQLCVLILLPFPWQPISKSYLPLNKGIRETEEKQTNPVQTFLLALCAARSSSALLSAEASSSRRAYKRLACLQQGIKLSKQ